MSIPEGWRSIRLGDFVVKQKGKKPQNLSKDRDMQYQYPYVDIKAFEKNQIEKYTDGEDCVLCNDGDFLIVWDGSRSGLVGKAIKGALGSTIMKINFPKIFKGYAYYFLKSKFLELNTRVRGSGTPHVDPDILWNYTFNIPPLPEQQKIVAKIEELFTEIDKGIENLQKAKEQIKVYKQSVLKYAFGGRLINFDVKNLNPLIDYLTKIVAGKSFKCEERPPKTDEIGIVKVSSVTWGEFNENESKTCLDEMRVDPKYFIQTGDFLFSRANTIELVGACVIVNKISKKLMLSDKILRFGLIDLNNKYLLYFLRSPQGRTEIESRSTGNQNSMRNISQKSIGNIRIPVPKEIIQRRVVDEIEKRFVEAENMELNLNISLKQAEALKQSILKKAFEGKLL